MVDSPSSVVLTVWDSTSDPPADAGQVCLWNGYAETGSCRSLLTYVDSHGERLRRRYVAWIHELGESRLRGKRLIERLILKDGFSYWWMTLFVEQSPWKSPSIVDALRLLALEEIIAQQKPRRLRLVSANRRIHEVIHALCEALRITYELERPADTRPRPWNGRRVYEALPKPVQALSSLFRYLSIHWPLRQATRSSVSGVRQEVFVCSYFDNVDPEAADRGRFCSHYWDGLPALLNRLGRQSIWLQLFIPCQAVPTAREALNKAQRFNQRSETEGSHTFLEAYLSWPLVLRVLAGWLSLIMVSTRLSEIKRAFRPQGSRLSLWPIMREDWYASMRGPTAMTNLIWLELFGAALNDLPRQEKGLYLCENQSWERALIHAWRGHGHGELIAVAHSTMRFWDLRYFIDPRTAQSTDPCPMPQADLVAVNGQVAMDAQLSMGVPRRTIVECEALRYGELAARRVWQPSGTPGNGAMKVLILSDHRPASTSRLLNLIAAARPHLSAGAVFTVRPHPNCDVRPAEYPTLSLEVVRDPLLGILQNFDVAIAGAITSAALDAYLAGMPVVVMLDPTGLNVSPLRGQPGVRFVSSTGELVEALQTPHQVDRRPAGNEFFFLDPLLPRWSRLLAS